MDSKKKQLLDKTYDEYLKLMIYDFPLDKISDIVANDVTGYGSTLDEKVLEINRLRKIVSDQREQGAGPDIQISAMPVHHRISPDEVTAIYTDEAEISMVVDGTRNGFLLRLSSVFEFNQNTWKLVHFHGSKAVETEDDTWHLNEWKRKNEKLQKLVDEKTAELYKQNRELEIEAALERVRARTMAMQKSDELAKIVNGIFNTLDKLDYNPQDCTIFTFDSKNQNIDCWSSLLTTEGSSAFHYSLPFIDHPMFNKMLHDHRENKQSLIYQLAGDEKVSFDNLFFEIVRIPEMETVLRSITEIYANFIFMSKGAVVAFTVEPMTENDITLLQRFSKVVDLSYTRFLDLQKAEALAREAQIEAALERVRSRSLAMKQSIELQEVISVVFVQMQQLGIKADASVINILTEDSKDFYMWIGTMGQAYAQKIRIPYIKHPVFDVFHDARERGETFKTNSLTREEKDSFFEYAFQCSDLRLMPAERKKYVMNSAGFARSFAWSKNSGITIQNYAGIPYSDDENNTLIRFAQVFEQAYTRFLDVENAEAQTREAVKRAALDRVHGEIASMRTKNDLTNITPLMWKELNTLGVRFIRCGVLIMDVTQKLIQTYLSKPNGDSLSAFEMPFDSEVIGADAVKHWKQNKIYYEHWDKNQFVDFMQNLIKAGKVQNTESYQGSNAPPESLYLHFVPFKHGMLYVGNIEPLKEEELQLVKALSETLSVAYSRYEDFKLLEEAKNKIELTLIELKSTQSQLIQSEKMASLGELTAGIAHEIQNPLNFVNNFSEVSKELIEELMSEKLKVKSERDEELEDEILNDISQNLEKINNHGKRASDIVKGMLAHSRTSSGVKEPTDINALADEYLRLAYHGLRAKDKNFNADFKMEFDENLPKINVIPQDIGRVLLNLINNAFYAVDKKAKSDGEDYKPEIIVSTKKDGKSIEIRVNDNGDGIPEEIKDKIFQPFFTTKPTGSGTGLGLSLSYDIVKAHGGELKVKTVEGEGLSTGKAGSEFIIQFISVH